MEGTHTHGFPTSVIIVSVKELKFIEYSTGFHTLTVFESSIYFQTNPTTCYN